MQALRFVLLYPAIHSVRRINRAMLMLWQRWIPHWSPGQLLDALQSIEQEQGAACARPNAAAPRTLDLDILLFGKRRSTMSA